MPMEDREIVILESEYDRLKMENYQLKDDMYALKDEIFKIKEEKFALREKLQQALHDLELLKQAGADINQAQQSTEGLMRRRPLAGNIGTQTAVNAGIGPRRRLSGSVYGEDIYGEQQPRSVRRPHIGAGNGPAVRSGISARQSPLGSQPQSETYVEGADYEQETVQEQRDIHQVVKRASATSRDGRVRRPPGRDDL